MKHQKHNENSKNKQEGLIIDECKKIYKKEIMRILYMKAMWVEKDEKHEMG